MNNMEGRLPGSVPTKSDWASAYKDLSPVLLAVLRRLSSRGFAMDAGQGLDLVHDFFVDVWPRVRELYDPGRGPMRSYAIRAFVNFARPRLIRELRWRQALAETIEEQPTEEDPSLGPDMAHIKAALGRLSETDRALLTERFAPDAPSERSLARARGITRYTLRERVATALARFVAALEEGGSLGDFEFQLARILFGDGRTIPDAAAELHVTEAQIRAGRRRLLRSLGQLSKEASNGG